MKWNEFFKDFFTSKKLVMKDVLMYLWWVALGITVVSFIWTLASANLNYWDFENWMTFIWNLLYSIVKTRIVIELLIAAFDVHEKLTNKKEKK